MLNFWESAVPFLLGNSKEASNEDALGGDASNGEAPKGAQRDQGYFWI